MAGTLVRFNATHASPQGTPSAFRPVSLMEARVTLGGRTFLTTIREGASVDALIEKVANENGGWVSRRYYPEFKAWEIIAVKIGDQLLVKSSEAGIHWSLGNAGIPMAVTKDQEIVFPNGEELRVGKDTNAIALWTTSSNFDPGSIKDLNDKYSGSGGILVAEDVRDKISKSHGGVRSEKLMLEENILVLNKDTGEILSVSQHASREHDPPPAAMPEVINISLPSCATCFPATPEPQRFMPAVCDAIRGRLDAYALNKLVVRTFDGAITEMVRVQLRPFSQEKSVLEGRVQAIPPGKSAPSEPRTLAFCMLPSPDTGSASCSVRPSGPALPAIHPNASQRAPIIPARPSAASAGTTKPGRPVALQQDSRARENHAIASAPSADSVEKAWLAGRFAPLRLDVADSAMPFAGSGPKPSIPEKTAGKKGRRDEKLRSLIRYSALLSSILQTVRRLARMRKQEKKAAERADKKAQKKELPVSRPNSSRRRGRGSADAGHAKAATTAKEVRLHSIPARMQEKSQSRHMGAFLPGKAGQSGTSAPARTPGRSKAAEAPLSAQTRKAFRRPYASGKPARAAPRPFSCKKKKPDRYFIYEMLGLLGKKRKRKPRPLRSVRAG